MREQLIAEFGEFLRRVEGKRSFNPNEVAEVNDFWKRLTGETTYCTSCSKVTSENFTKLKKWFKDELAKLPKEDPIADGEGTVYAKPYKRKKK
jgi:hypothetical protein